MRNNYNWITKEYSKDVVVSFNPALFRIPGDKKPIERVYEGEQPGPSVPVPETVEPDKALFEFFKNSGVTPGAIWNGIKIISEEAPRKDARGERYRVVLAKCHCGKVFLTRWNSIKAGMTKSCGCIKRGPKHKNPVKIGFTSGMLLVLSEEEVYKDKQGRTKRMVKVACDCGTIKIIQWNSVQSGMAKSCGCQKGRKTYKDWWRSMENG